MRLLSEQRKGPTSPFYQWLQQLPKQVCVCVLWVWQQPTVETSESFIVARPPTRQVDSPVNWSSEQLQQLSHAHLVHKVTEQQQEWGALHDRLCTQGLVDTAAAPSKQVGVRGAEESCSRFSWF